MIPLRAAAIALVFAALEPLPAAVETPTPAPLAVVPQSAPPHVWVFCGTPGDEEHHKHYEKMLASLRAVLKNRFGIPEANVVVLYGPVSAGYDGECTREKLLAELGKVVAHTQTKDPVPVWLIFLGHANAIAGGAFYNLPGPDISTHDLGEALRKASPSATMVLLATTACSGTFLRPLAGPGRIIVTATTTDDAENETEYPNALTTALESPETDANHDGLVSVTELFLTSHKQVQSLYEAEGLMIKEHSLLDGNGDGRGTQRPAAADATPASHIGLRIGTGDGAPDKFD